MSYMRKLFMTIFCKLQAGSIRCIKSSINTEGGWRATVHSLVLWPVFIRNIILSIVIHNHRIVPRARVIGGIATRDPMTHAPSQAPE